MNNIAFKLIYYNKKVVKICKRFKMILIYFIFITILCWLVLDMFWFNFYNDKLILPKNINQFYFILSLVVMILAIKIGYHENKWVKIGRLEFSENTICVDTYEVLAEYNFANFKIQFDDNGYEGKSNWLFPSSIGALSFKSGVNEIYIINRKNESELHEYSFLIENEERLKELQKILLDVNERYQ